MLRSASSHYLALHIQFSITISGYARLCRVDAFIRKNICVGVDSPSGVWKHERKCSCGNGKQIRIMFVVEFWLNRPCALCTFIETRKGLNTRRFVELINFQTQQQSLSTRNEVHCRRRWPNVEFSGDCWKNGSYSPNFHLLAFLQRFFERKLRERWEIKGDAVSNTRIHLDSPFFVATSARNNFRRFRWWKR